MFAPNDLLGRPNTINVNHLPRLEHLPLTRASATDTGICHPYDHLQVLRTFATDTSTPKVMELTCSFLGGGAPSRVTPRDQPKWPSGHSFFQLETVHLGVPPNISKDGAPEGPFGVIRHLDVRNRTRNQSKPNLPASGAASLHAFPANAITKPILCAILLFSIVYSMFRS